MGWRGGSPRCCAQVSPPVEWTGKVRPLYKKGDHLRPENWRPVCCTVTEAKGMWMPTWMVVFGRIQRTLYAAGTVPDNMWGSSPGRSTQEASFLHDMYLDDGDLEAFMAPVDVKGAFPNTPHRLIEEAWRQLGLTYGHFVGEYLRTRRYTVAAGFHRSGGHIPVHACHAMDSAGVSTTGEDATHVAGTSIHG